MPRILTTADEAYWDTRMTAEEVAMSTLQSRVTTSENKVADLVAWREAKAAAITSLGAAPTSSVIDILGIQVPTGASFTALVAYVATIKTKLDAILVALRQREIIVT